MLSVIHHILSRFRRDESGATLVEFALVLPMLLVIFGVIIEGGRLFWSYQTTISGVRDATRYLARAAPNDICTSGGSVAGFSGQLTTIVQQSSGGVGLLPNGITVTSVTPSFACVTGSYRGGTVPIATVTANLTVTFPLSGLFTFFGGGNLTTLNTTVTDRNRIYGT